jgi:hypothetical protein
MHLASALLCTDNGFALARIDFSIRNAWVTS